MTAHTESLPGDILRFWFGDALASAEAARHRSKVWFTTDARFDAELGRRFGDCPQRARSGEFDDWGREPEPALARILALDQFPRNLYRGKPLAFAFDAAATAAASHALDAGFDRLVHPLMAAFMYLPFEHAENVELQARAVACYQALEQRAPAGLEAMFASFTDYARRHQAVIERFGRFPHRNVILGRDSTPGETQYLASGGEHFGVRGA